MYKLEIISLSEIAQPATPPSNVLKIGELIELKSRLKQAVDYDLYIEQSFSLCI